MKTTSPVDGDVGLLFVQLHGTSYGTKWGGEKEGGVINEGKVQQ